MVPVRVLGLAVDTGMQPVVLLTPLEPGPGARRYVPVWIGAQEAASIQAALDGEAPPRPLAHDLMRSLLRATGASVVRVAITRLEDGVFHAELAVSTPRGPAVLDCRPSDGIALGLRTGAPLLVAEAVLAAAGVQEDEQDALEHADQEVAEFRHFLDDVDPEDFGG